MIRLILFLISLLLSSYSFSINVILEETDKKSKQDVYNKILNLLINDFDSVIKKSVDDIRNHTDDIFYVIGSSNFNIINNIPSSKNNQFVLLGTYSPPKNFDSYKNWKMISLFSDPYIFYSLITSKFKNINNFHIIYNKNKNDWFVDKLKNSPDVNIIGVSSKKEAIIKYRKLFTYLQKNDCIILSPEGFFDNIIISEVLKSSWSGKFFTTSVLSSHSNKGILMAPIIHFPELKEFFKDYNDNIDENDKIIGLPIHTISGNKRMAKHLGFSRKEMSKIFDVVY